MNVLLMLGAFYTVYGLLGLAGWQRLPACYRGHRWTARFTRRLGLSWLLLGLPWLAVWALLHAAPPAWPVVCAVIVGVSLPSLVYTWALDRRYRKWTRRARREAREAQEADLGGQRPPRPRR